MNKKNIHSLQELEDRTRVFRDRVHAGEILAGMLEEFRDSKTLVLAIPAGGVPVAATIAGHLGLEPGILPVSKILFPWTTESGFGAVAFDGTEWVNEHLVNAGQLDEESVRSACEKAKTKVERRLKKFSGFLPPTDLQNRNIILVDDGIAAGSTMRAGILALKKANAGRLSIAVPTAHASSVYAIIEMADNIYCANLRGGMSFAVADAYRNWSDVTETEVSEILDRFRK